MTVVQRIKRKICALTGDARQDIFGYIKPCSMRSAGTD